MPGPALADCAAAASSRGKVAAMVGTAPLSPFHAVVLLRHVVGGPPPPAPPSAESRRRNTCSDALADVRRPQRSSGARTVTARSFPRASAVCRDQRHLRRHRRVGVHRCRSARGDQPSRCDRNDRNRGICCRCWCDHLRQPPTASHNDFGGARAVANAVPPAPDIGHLTTPRASVTVSSSDSSRRRRSPAGLPRPPSHRQLR